MKLSLKLKMTLLIVVFLMNWISFSVVAAGMTVAVTGPGTVRAGDTVKITVSVNGTGLRAILGEIRYNAAHVTYKSSGGLPGGWKFDEFDTSAAGKISFLAIDDKMEAPLSGSKQLFTLDFQIKTTVPAGTAVSISAEGVEGSDGSSDFNAPAASYAVSLAAPLSSNNSLASLTVSNAQISPGFDKNVTLYSASVGFDIASLSINAVPEDAKAAAAVSGNTLKAGGTTDVLVTVTAENGNRKTYTIRVTRAQDPNYTASSNARLNAITPSIGILSPPFSPDTTSYYLYLPYEISQFQAVAQAEDAKGSVYTDEPLTLAVGANIYLVKGIGEDQSEKEYKITVFRMPQAGEELPDATPTPEADSSDESLESQVSGIDNENKDKTSPGMLILIAAVALLAGTAIGYFLPKGKKIDK